MKIKKMVKALNKIKKLCTEQEGSCSRCPFMSLKCDGCTFLEHSIKGSQGIIPALWNLDYVKCDK